jgi:hypothetical protein
MRGCASVKYDFALGSRLIGKLLFEHRITPFFIVALILVWQQRLRENLLQASSTLPLTSFPLHLKTDSNFIDRPA